jgi:hypothetical protein
MPTEHPTVARTFARAEAVVRRLLENGAHAVPAKGGAGRKEPGGSFLLDAPAGGDGRDVRSVRRRPGLALRDFR